MAVLREVTVVIETEEKLRQLRTGLTTSDRGQEAEEEAGLSSEVDRQSGEHLGLVVGQLSLGQPTEEQTGSQKFGQAMVNLKVNHEVLKVVDQYNFLIPGAYAKSSHNCQSPQGHG